MKWEDVRARSEHEWHGLLCYCWECHLNHMMVEMPCERHCETAEERIERDKRYHDQLKSLRYRRHPLLDMVPRE